MINTFYYIIVRDIKIKEMQWDCIVSKNSVIEVCV